MSSDSGKITADDLLDTLAAADALEAFLRLPVADQESFSRWIGKARDDESHWRRINALALAIRLGPLEAGGARPTALPG